eukprot:1394795-Rhodomonas_salina.4
MGPVLVLVLAQVAAGRPGAEATLIRVMRPRVMKLPGFPKFHFRGISARHESHGLQDQNH